MNEATHDPGVRHRRARIAADERVRRAGGQRQPPRDEVPENSARQAGHDDVGRHQVQIHESLAHRFGHRRAEQERRHEVEKPGPQHGLPRRKHARGHDGGDRIGGVVESVDEVEDQRDADDQDGQLKSAHR